MFLISRVGLNCLILNVGGRPEHSTGARTAGTQKFEEATAVQSLKAGRPFHNFSPGLARCPASTGMRHPPCEKGLSAGGC